MSRRSTVAVSTFTPALKVLSTIFPLSTFLILVRTNAGPLPGLTCWNSWICYSWLSMRSTSPFLKSAVVATADACSLLARRGHMIVRAARGAHGSDDPKCPVGGGQQFCVALADDQGVLDTHPAPAG